MSEPRPSVRRPLPPPPPMPAAAASKPKSPFDARGAVFAPPPPVPSSDPFRRRPRSGFDTARFDTNEKAGLSELDASARAAEVSILWGEASVLHVEHLSPPRAFYVGEPTDGEEVDFLIGEDALGARRMPLCVEVDGRIAAVVPATAEVTLRHDGSVLRRAALEEAGRLLSCEEVPGATALVVPEGGTVRVEQGAFVFLVRSVATAKRVGGGFTGFDLRVASYVGGSMAFFGLMLVLMAFAPPRPASLTLQDIDQSSRLVRYVINASESRPPDPLPSNAGAAGGPESAAAPGEEGKAGDPKVKESGRLAQMGSAERTLPNFRPERSVESVISQTVIGTLRQLDWHQQSAAFTSANAIAADPMNFLGALMGDAFGPGGGNGGVGMNGTGVGGGHGVDGSIGVGALGTIGGPGSGGDRGTYGTCKGERCSFGRDHKGGPPTVRHSPPTVVGSLSREAIRRVVRQHLPEVRACYEQGLISRPDLEGRVAVRFIINPNGSVQTALVQESSIGQRNVESCVSGAVRRWTFPTPEGQGIVVVNYPFQFTRTD